MKFALTLIGAAVIATGAWAGTSLVDDSDPARTVSLQGVTTGATPTGATTNDTAEDISGPCDEAEHANDPECAGTTSPAPATAPPAATTDEAEDVSGPCDEAEHADDPRCTGGTATQANDNDHDDDDAGDDHGRNRGRGGDDDHDEDRSGSNSGRG